MGSKYTVICNTDEEGGFGSSTDLIDDGIAGGDGDSNLNGYGYRNVSASISNDENITILDDDENDNDNDDESFVTANNNVNMITASPTNPSDGIQFVSLSDTEHTTATSSRQYNTMFRTTFFADDTIKVYNVIFAENAFAIKLCKFTVFTFISIWLMFYFVRFMVRLIHFKLGVNFLERSRIEFSVPLHVPTFEGRLRWFSLIHSTFVCLLNFVFMFIKGWEHDSTLTLSDVWRYEGNLIVTDAMFFFVIGRLFRQRGIDHLEWIGWCFAANVYSSFITDFKMFQHSFTLYEMHCKWPWQLWVFTILVVPIIVTIVYLHFEYAWRHKIVVQKFLEMIFCNTFLLLPLITSSYFHFHHWFAGLIIGMHLNYDVWWSRATMAWCWGCYINGIAVYGRDPVLTCAYAYFMSTTQRCPFVQCYQEALSNPTHMDQNNVTVTPMIPPDWKNCSSDAFHP